MCPGTEGGVTLYFKSQISNLKSEPETLFIYDAAERYKADGIPLIILGGKEYGTGSSRDWAAKGTKLLGVKAVIAESFERIHRSNLVGMGVLPLCFKEGTNAQTLGLDGSETYSILGLTETVQPRQDLTLEITRTHGRVDHIPVTCRIDTPIEVEYYRHGGILPYVLRQLIRQAAPARPTAKKKTPAAKKKPVVRPKAKSKAKPGKPDGKKAKASKKLEKKAKKEAKKALKQKTKTEKKLKKKAKKDAKKAVSRKKKKK
jgi:hypothetical protein